MLRLAFDGWFQCRLATDPDPYDEPSGVSGFHATLASEPPFDRVIRCNDPVAPRSHARPVGVAVRQVVSAGGPAPLHPLAGARVDLLGEPRFEGRNGLLAGTGEEPIHPFHLQVAGAGAVLRRLDPPPAWGPHEVPDADAVRHRFGGGVLTSKEDWAEIRAAAGIHDEPGDWDRKRRRALRRDRNAATDPGTRAELDTRLEFLHAAGLLPVRVRYGFELRGRGELEGKLPEQVDLDRPWPLRFWLGAWDCDGLCGFVSGELQVPLAGAGASARAGPASSAL